MRKFFFLFSETLQRTLPILCFVYLYFRWRSEGRFSVVVLLFVHLFVCQPSPSSSLSLSLPSLLSSSLSSSLSLSSSKQSINSLSIYHIIYRSINLLTHSSLYLFIWLFEIQFIIHLLTFFFSVVFVFFLDWYYLFIFDSSDGKWPLRNCSKSVHSSAAHFDGTLLFHGWGERLGYFC